MPVAPGTFEYWLTRHVHDGEGLGLPPGTAAAASLQTGQEAESPSPAGVVLAAAVSGSAMPAGSLHLGDSLDTALGRNAPEVRSRLGLAAGDLSRADTVIDAVWRVLTVLADPSGQTGPKPIMPTSDGALEMLLAGHGAVRREVFDWGSHPAAGAVRARLQADYRAARGEVAAGRAPVGHHLKALGWELAKYRRMGLTDWRELLPPEYRDTDAPAEPATVISDNFNRSDQTGLGTSAGGWSWTSEVGSGFDIQGNAASNAGSSTRDASRAESSLSGADHYSQTRALLFDGTRQSRVCVRFNSSNDERYEGSVKNSGTNTYGLFRLSTTDAQTSLGAASASAPGVDKTLRLQVSGSSLELFYNGASVLTATDTNISGNLRCGIGAGVLSAADQVQHEDFDAGDLGSGAAARAAALSSRRRRV
jgi:hypothetical protein